jgi:hypothetical protein
MQAEGVNVEWGEMAGCFICSDQEYGDGEWVWNVAR